MDKRPKNAVIITPPIPSAGVYPLKTLAQILSGPGGKIFIVTGNEGSRIKDLYGGVHVDSLDYRSSSNLLIKACTHAYLQAYLSYHILKLFTRIDVTVFFLDANALLLPVITAKLLGKKTVFVLAASIAGTSHAKGDLLSRILVASEKIGFMLSDSIVLYSPILIKSWRLDKYTGKISFGHHHYVDPAIFKIKKPISGRPNVVGYIGRFSEEKGIMNFIRAIPEILRSRPDVEFLIAGTGQLSDEISAYLSENNLGGKVQRVDWIPHDRLPDYLNDLKVIVLPSYTEGLPNMMIEAMACGTPVAASPVGAIPGFIIDDETGFLMENNSPGQIARTVIRAIEYPELEAVVENGKKMIEANFIRPAPSNRLCELLKG